MTNAKANDNTVDNEGEKLSADIEKFCVADAKHADKGHSLVKRAQLMAIMYGNCNWSNELVTGMSGATRKNAIHSWNEQIGCLTWDAKEKKYTVNIAKRAALKKEYTSREAVITYLGAAKKYWDFKPEAAYKGNDFKKDYAAFMAKQAKCFDEHGDDEKTVGRDAYDAHIAKMAA